MRGRARTLRAGLAATLLLVLLAGTAWWFVVAARKPSPPRTLRMATGPAGSASADIGARYRDRLARAGVRLELVETAGAVANLSLLRDSASGTGGGFVQAGTTATYRSGLPCSRNGWGSCSFPSSARSILCCACFRR